MWVYLEVVSAFRKKCKVSFLVTNICFHAKGLSDCDSHIKLHLEAVTVKKGMERFSDKLELFIIKLSSFTWTSHFHWIRWKVLEASCCCSGADRRTHSRCTRFLAATFLPWTERAHKQSRKQSTFKWWDCHTEGQVLSWYKSVLWLLVVYTSWIHWPTESDPTTALLQFQGGIDWSQWGAPTHHPTAM